MHPACFPTWVDRWWMTAMHRHTSTLPDRTGIARTSATNTWKPRAPQILARFSLRSVPICRQKCVKVWSFLLFFFFCMLGFWGQVWKIIPCLHFFKVEISWCTPILLCQPMNACIHITGPCQPMNACIHIKGLCQPMNACIHIKGLCQPMNACIHIKGLCQPVKACIHIKGLCQPMKASVLLLGFHKRGFKGHPEEKEGAPSPPPPPPMKKAAIQSYRINKGKHVYTYIKRLCGHIRGSGSPCHSLMDYRNTNTACILDLVWTYTIFLFKEVGHLKSKTRQYLNNHEVWNFSKLSEPTLKHPTKHPRGLPTIVLHWHHLFLILWLFCCNHCLLFKNTVLINWRWN